ncbi:MAG: protein-(glutamine-N5) methyltransferase, release factor-specific [Chloroflexi bacterium RBG_16_69_14]|nr:MAG: protein-(glutamine-N5) methyltransferase, release factor-specific [Chloroflexi bacterium RBG_16_69_14]
MREGAQRLLESGSETPRLDAELLLAHAVGVGRTVILAHPEAPVGADAARGYRADIERRATGEPVAYIRGLKEFYGLAFQVDRRALIPRPETERLVELAETEVMRRLGLGRGGTVPLRILDVGTGSGAVVVALAVSLRRLGAADVVEILALDSSAEALDLARENAVGHAVADRIAFVEADLLPDDGSRVDLVLANLPYVRRDAMASLPRATTFEPSLALDGGPDGLEVIGRLLDRLPDALVDDGLALLEIGGDQGEAIVTLVADRLPGWSCAVVADLAGSPRVARVWRG